MLNTLTRIFPLKTAEYVAKLEGQAGFTGRGLVEINFWSHGGVDGEVDLRGIAGLKAELFLGGRRIIDIPLKNGRAVRRFTDRQLTRELMATVGDPVEIRQNGDVILRGALGYR